MAAVSKAASRSFGYGIGGIALLTLTILFGITASSGLPGAPTTLVRAAFTNVGASLKVGDDVRENSVRIGRVSALTNEDGRAIVTLELDGHPAINADARAAIWDQSALAKKFVELDRGNSATGPLGDRILPEASNVNSADLDQLLDVLDPATRAALTSSVRQLGVGMAGHSQDLHDLLVHAPVILTGVGTISSALSSPQADLPSLLKQADQLTGALKGRQQQLSDLVAQVGTTARAVTVDNGKPLQDTLKDLPATLTDARASFDALDKPLDDARTALATVRPGVEALGQATPDLRGVLREGPAPLNQVPGVVKKTEPALTDLTKAVADARPLVPALSRGLTDLATPLNVLARYSTEVVNFFRRIESMVSTEVSPGVHGARVGLAIEGLATVAGGVIHDPLVGTDAYPAPGQADRERTASPLNGLPPNLLPGGTK
jgi:phospholipid/cholesterol/gamma-HCH transport system substrate-binding protein